MKNSHLFIAFLLFPFLGFAQAANEEVKLDYHQLITQGLGEESILMPTIYPIQRKTIEIEKGKHLEYVEKGNPLGTPVIFLHGLTDSWHSFEKVLPLLPDDYHAFAISQRGHGNSAKGFPGYHPKYFAKDVAVFMQKLNMHSAIVVGHSMGGLVAQQFAVNYPGLLKALVIVGSDARWKDNPGLPELFIEVQKLKDTTDKDFMDAFQKGSLAKPIEQSYYDTIVSEGLKVPARIFKAALKGMLDVDLLPLLHTIKTPVLMLWGDKDSVCFLPDQEAMQSRMNHAKLVVYASTGHALHWEEPRRFVNDLVDFFRQIN